MATDAIAIHDGLEQIVAQGVDVQNSGLNPPARGKTEPALYRGAASASRSGEETGDEANRFLLCVLVSESAKRVKASAAKMGESLPMTMIVRALLRSCRREMQSGSRPLARPGLNLADLKGLSNGVLREEIARHSRDRVQNSEVRLARAEQLGDDTKIKTERDGLDRAIELRDRLANRGL
jgi:hypothetical protein